MRASLDMRTRSIMRGSSRQCSFYSIWRRYRACRTPLWRPHGWCIYLTSLMIALAGLTIRAEQTKPQCWDCLQRLAMELPPVNAQEDPMYEQGLTSASMLPALSHCSLDDGDSPVLQQIIEIFTDALLGGGGAAYVREHLDQMPQVSMDDRAKLTYGAALSLSFTRRHLIDHNCNRWAQRRSPRAKCARWQ